MKCSGAVIVLVGLARHIQAESATDRSAGSLQDAFLDELANALVDNLFRHADMENATLGKPGQLAVRLREGHSGALGASAGYKPQFLRGKATTLGRRPGIQVLRASEKDDEVAYGSNWYKQTRDAIKKTQKKSGQEEYLAAWRASKAADRRDLYTNDWEGDQYKGSPINILTVLIALFILVPTIGVIYAALYTDY